VCTNLVQNTYVILLSTNRLLRVLRSGDQSLMCVPFTHSAFVYNRSFSVAGPRMWNVLPLELRSIADIECFKKRLKTELFTNVYSAFCSL
jgi:hypothetical protein